MADPIRGYFDDNISPNAAPIHTDRDAELRRRLRLAACALLLEMAHADDDFSDAERAHIAGLIREHFGLDAEGAQRLLELCESERAHGGEIQEFAILIRDSFEPGEKTRLIMELWRLALSDGRIAGREERLIERVSDTIGVAPDDVKRIRAELEG